MWRQAIPNTRYLRKSYVNGLDISNLDVISLHLPDLKSNHHFWVYVTDNIKPVSHTCNWESLTLEASLINRKLPGFDIQHTVEYIRSLLNR